MQNQARLLILASLLIAATALLLLVYSRQESLSAEALRSTVESERNQLLAQQSAILAGQANADTLRAQAEQQSRIAYARELAAYSMTVTGHDPQLGLLLALESANTTYGYDQTYTEESYLALQQALSTRLLATLRNSDQGIRNATFSEDGSRILAGTPVGKVFLWDGEGKYISDLNSETELIDVYEFSWDRSRILTAGCTRNSIFCWDRGVAHLWDWNGNLVASLEGHATNIAGADFSPDGKRVVTASLDGLVQMWDKEGKHLYSLNVPNGTIIRAAFYPDSHSFLVFGTDNRTRIFLTFDGSLVATLDGTPTTFGDSNFSKDGLRFVIQDQAGNLNLYNNNGRLVANLETKPATYAFVSYSLNSRRLLIYREGTTYVFNSETGALLATIDDARLDGWANVGRISIGFVTRQCKNYAPKDCRQEWTNTIQLWDSDGQPIKTYDETAFVHFSPDGKRSVIVGSDGVARLYDNDGKLIAFLGSSQDRLFPFVVFSPDSTVIATGGCDTPNVLINDCRSGLTRLWNAETGALITKMLADVFPSASTFGPRSDRFLAVDDRGFTYLWSTRESPTDPRLLEGPIEIMINEAQLRIARTWTDDECRKYLHLERCQSTAK